jgi:hypothetical protein
MGRVGGKRTLVLADSLDIKETHSEFFGTLSGQQHDKARVRGLVLAAVCVCAYIRSHHLHIDSSVYV